MKRFLLILLMFLVAGSGTVHAQDFWTGAVFNDTLGVKVGNVQNFDWSSSGSGVAQGLGPAGTIPTAGTNFTFRYQSYLFALQDPDGNVVVFPGLNTNFEYTVVAVIPETVQIATDLGGGLFTAIFRTLPGGTFYVYHDASPNINVATGMGFDDGTLVASGSINGDQVSSFTYNSNTGTGIGSATIFGQVGYANPDYLDPALTIVGFRIEGTLNYPPLDSTTAAYFLSRAAEGNLPNYTVAANDLALKVDTSSKFLEEINCCIDLEKQISIDGGLTWQNADNCVVPDTPTVPAPGSGEYRLVVRNCGNTTLTTVAIDDPVLGIVNVPIADLGPGEERILYGSDIPNLAEHEVCQSSGQYLNTSTVNAICSDPQETPVDASDTACLICEEVGACRMTGGHVTVNPIDTTLSYVEGSFAEVLEPGKKAGKKFVQSTSEKKWYTVGGQIGAPSANTTPATGHWTHTQHAGFEGSFTFSAGTSSAPPGTEISTIVCGDPGWCVQARCAPNKQIFWDGIGYFNNKKGDPNPVFAGCNVVTGPAGTQHYFKAHVGDFGEPGNNGKQKPENQCEWVTGGLDISTINLISQVPDPKFGDKGGQACDTCPDWYEIEIHCTTDPSSPVIYYVGDFIDGGNLQLHPEVGTQCPF